MDILIKGNVVIAYAPYINYGVYNESIEKWKLSDENEELMYYMIDDGFTLVERVELPEDYEPGKYFYEDNMFVFNMSWKPNLRPEERIAQLEEIVAIHEDNDAELLYQICLLQLGVTEDEML